MTQLEQQARDRVVRLATKDFSATHVTWLFMPLPLNPDEVLPPWALAPGSTEKH